MKLYAGTEMTETSRDISDLEELSEFSVCEVEKDLSTAPLPALYSRAANHGLTAPACQLQETFTMLSLTRSLHSGSCRSGGNTSAAPPLSFTNFANLA